MPLPITFDSEQYEATAQRVRGIYTQACPLPYNGHTMAGSASCEAMQRKARRSNSEAARACRLCQHHHPEAAA